MTKFEEEFKALTSWDWVNVDLIQQILAKFGNWHSDEEFQEMKESYWNQAESILSMLEEIKSLKSQLQQQALPVVPECVGVAIESLPDHCSAFEAISLIEEKIKTLPVENEDWLPVYNWLCEGVENQDIFALAFITGKYEVEKPQLFYLREKNTNYYLNKSKNNGLELVPNPYFDEDNQFTKQEIDSMQTGSYEQIEVEK